MPRISNVKWPKFDLRYGYLFDIRSEEELHDYWRGCRNVLGSDKFCTEIVTKISTCTLTVQTESPVSC